MSLTQLITRAQLGIDAFRSSSRSTYLQWITRLHRRRTAGNRGTRGARSRALGHHQLGFRVSRAPHHGQSRARRPAQDGRALRLADCPRNPGGFSANRYQGSARCRLFRRTGARRRLLQGGWLAAFAGRLPTGRAGGGGTAAKRRRGEPVARLADSLCQLACRSLQQPERWRGTGQRERRRTLFSHRFKGLDLEDVYGQQQARRALEIAASGGHHMLMMGPPGTGKSMLAQRLISILPPMSEAEAMSSASIRSICHQPVGPHNWLQRPFQSPHHTVSGIALVGGGRHATPGEISLAHNGVLFLDELTEFDRRSIEVLREPLESGCIHISRASGKAEFPARFQLIAAMNPCPGGCESIADCDCSPEQLNRYRRKLSAPLLDRIDIQIELGRLHQRQLFSANRDKPAKPARPYANG